MNNERRQIPLQIQSIAPDVSKRHGNAQFKLEVMFPWEIEAGFQHPSRVWVDVQEGDPAHPEPGIYTATVERGSIKKDKDGEYDSHYRWNVLSVDWWNAPTPEDETDAAPVADSEDQAPSRWSDIQALTNRREAVKAAAQVTAALYYHGADNFDIEVDEIEKNSARLFEHYLNLIENPLSIIEE